MRRTRGVSSADGLLTAGVAGAALLRSVSICVRPLDQSNCSGAGTTTGIGAGAGGAVTTGAGAGMGDSGCAATGSTCGVLAIIGVTGGIGTSGKVGVTDITDVTAAGAVTTSDAAAGITGIGIADRMSSPTDATSPVDSPSIPIRGRGTNGVRG